MKNIEVYDIVNKIIFAELEKGIIPWKRPWLVNFPINLASKKEYQGFNWWLLMLIQEEKNYKSNIWATFNQINIFKGKIKKGEHSTPVVFWNILEIKTDKIDTKGKAIVKKIPLLRYYKVFNLDQTEGIKMEDTKISIENNYTGDSIISKYQKQVSIRYIGNEAYYSPINDKINIPNRKQFTSNSEFYATNFHEMVHSTGHLKRLNRFNQEGYNHIHGSEDYSKEELIAEMGSAYLCAKVKILPNIVKNHTAYLQNWLKALKNDKTLLVSAAGKAQRAVEFILK